MSVLQIFGRRFRGFRIVDIAAVSAILVIAVTSYAMKTFASAEDADMSSLETHIGGEEKRIRLLKAEIARLEAPDRVERLSAAYLQMTQPDPVRVIPAALLADSLAHPKPPKPPKAAPAAAPTPDPSEIDPSVGNER